MWFVMMSVMMAKASENGAETAPVTESSATSAGASRWYIAAEYSVAPEIRIAATTTVDSSPEVTAKGEIGYHFRGGPSGPGVFLEAGGSTVALLKGGAGFRWDVPLAVAGNRRVSVSPVLSGGVASRGFLDGTFCDGWLDIDPLAPSVEFSRERCYEDPPIRGYIRPELEVVGVIREFRLHAGVASEVRVSADSKAVEVAPTFGLGLGRTF